MKELLERIATGLVSSPEEVKVEEEREGDRVRLRLRVAPADTGKVIGRGGQVARAIRTVLRAAAVQEGVLVRVDIEGGEGHPHQDHEDDLENDQDDGQDKDRAGTHSSDAKAEHE